MVLRTWYPTFPLCRCSYLNLEQAPSTISGLPLLKERVGVRSSPNLPAVHYFPIMYPICLVHGTSYLVPHFPPLSLFLPKSGTSTFDISGLPLLKERAGERSSPNLPAVHYFPIMYPICLVHGTSYLVPHFPPLALFLPKSGTSTFAISGLPLLKERAGERSSPNPPEVRYFPFMQSIYLVHGSSYLVHNLLTSQPPNIKTHQPSFPLTNSLVGTCLMCLASCVLPLASRI
jgi:hypothetical protein